MKKFFVTIAICIASATVFGQTQIAATDATDHAGLENVLISDVKLREGSNLVTVPEGRGTLKFFYAAGKFGEVVYTDASGKTCTLQPDTMKADGRTYRRLPWSDACFGSDQRIGLCICNPVDPTSGGYTIALLLPAKVQKLRMGMGRVR